MVEREDVEAAVVAEVAAGETPSSDHNIFCCLLSLASPHSALMISFSYGNNHFQEPIQRREKSTKEGKEPQQERRKRQEQVNNCSPPPVSV